jgi:hypothetical protein
MKSILAALLLISLVACTNEDDARRTLESAGFRDIRITGYEPFACAESDFSATGFSAINALGVRAKGTVCCGLVFKGCTVRY